MGNTAVRPIDRIELKLAPWSWPFAIERRAEIDSYFAQLRRHNPTLWHGRVLLSREMSVARDVLGGLLFETDYASLLAGLDWGVLGGNEKVCFGAAALITTDDAFIVGRMAGYTCNAGKVLFPSGSFDPADVSNGKMDIEFNVLRELEEETGLNCDDADPKRGWKIVLDGPHIPIVKLMRAKHPSDKLRTRILDNLAGQTHPEFSDMGSQIPSSLLVGVAHPDRAVSGAVGRRNLPQRLGDSRGNIEARDAVDR
jgi:8-oxo-dGTP pyrophosphatase MutT (NUDIX family)